MAYRAIKVGKPLHRDDLTRKTAAKGRTPSPRDVDLARLVNEVAAGPASQVLPWEYDGVPATARLAANRVVKQSDLEVYVSSRRDFPGVLLFSRVPLSGRQGRNKAP